MGFLFCLKGLISGFALLFVFLKPKPDNKKTPDLDRSGETVTVTFSLKIQPFVEGFLFFRAKPTFDRLRRRHWSDRQNCRLFQYLLMIYDYSALANYQPEESVIYVVRRFGSLWFHSLSEEPQRVAPWLEIRTLL